MGTADTYCPGQNACRFSPRSALFIGFAQIFALIPGASRAGVTITAARLLGINRQDAARFSMLLSIPTILGAVILALSKNVRLGVCPTHWGLAVSGLFCFFGWHYRHCRNDGANP